ncbi:anti-sigma factor [Nocardia sp. 2]|uniref:Anti-sigma factor n=1 Tax=Nocardia acididurans TaxID=2802282 RepID=A0ABS1M6W8_9NOCA|nr:anti-sigma factor [Nocardia acididurans]MBL1076398.1 anti-sigma factor [Nocardia acididurans]
MDEGVAQGDSKPTTIGLRVPALPEQLGMLRALAETVALVADFAVDEVNDIRLALDEVAMISISGAVPGSVLECELSYDSAGMTVRVETMASSSAVLEDGALSWHIVRTLTDSVRAVQEPFAIPARGYPTLVEFHWQRAVPR